MLGFQPRDEGSTPSTYSIILKICSYRLMVGQLPCKHLILVRIRVGAFNKKYGLVGNLV